MTLTDFERSQSRQSCNSSAKRRKESKRKVDRRLSFYHLRAAAADFPSAAGRRQIRPAAALDFGPLGRRGGIVPSVVLSVRSDRVVSKGETHCTVRPRSDACRPAAARGGDARRRRPMATFGDGGARLRLFGRTTRPRLWQVCGSDWRRRRRRSVVGGGRARPHLVGVGRLFPSSGEERQVAFPSPPNRIALVLK